MSRGHGSVQGTVLAILGQLRNGGRGLDTVSIASRVYRAVAPSKAQQVSVRRALAALARELLVEHLPASTGPNLKRWRLVSIEKRRNLERDARRLAACHRHGRLMTPT